MNSEQHNDQHNEQRVSIPQQAVPKDIAARRSMDRMRDSIREVAYKDNPEKLKKLAEKKRQVKERHYDGKNYAPHENTEERRKAVLRHGLTDEDLVDQLVVALLELNKDHLTEEWPILTTAQFTESEYITGASIMSYLKLLSKYGVRLSQKELAKRVQKEALDRLEKQDGRVTTPEELAANMMRKEDVMGKFSSEELDYMRKVLVEICDEHSGSYIPSVEVIKRESRLVYADVIRAFGDGSYAGFKKHFWTMYWDYKNKLKEDEDMDAREIAEQMAGMDTPEASKVEPETAVEAAAEPKVEPEKPAGPEAKAEEPEVKKEPEPKKEAKPKSGEGRKRYTKEEVIANLREYVAAHDGKLPTLDSLNVARKAGEKWFAYNTYFRHLGPSKEWRQYLESETDPEAVPEVETVPELSPAEPVTEVVQEVIPEPVVEATSAVEAVPEVTSGATPEPEPAPVEPEAVHEATPEPEPELPKTVPVPEIAFEPEDELEAAEPLNIHMKLSISVPGMAKPFELALDLASE